MLLPSETVAELKRVVKAFAAKANIPRLHAWKRLSDDDIWRQFVVQVAVVGSAASGERLARALREQNALGLQRLALLPVARRRALISRTLRDSGVRYASQDAEKCRKTAAIVRNFEFLSAFPGGPTGYIKSLVELQDDDARAARVAANMSYIKLKGARDLLVELGVVTDVVALDTRILNILRRAGAAIPRDIRTNPDRYKRLQNELLHKVCKPLGITGAALDRILFQSYGNLRLARAATPNIGREYEVDHSKAIREKHYKRLLKEGSNVVVLEPDIAKAFPDSAAVNDALRVVLKAGESTRGLTRRQSRSRAKVARAG